MDMEHPPLPKEWTNTQWLAKLGGATQELPIDPSKATIDECEL